MAVRKLWVTDTPWPASQAVQDAANAAGATEILHGIPPSLTAQITAGTTGYVELTVPDPGPVSDPLSTLLAALADAQTLEEVRAAAAAAAGGV